MLRDLDALERLVDTTIAPFLELWPAPRPAGVGLAIERLIAFRLEAKQFRAKQRDLMTHRRRICSVLADLMVLVEAAKPEAEKRFGTKLPQSQSLMKLAFAVKKATHAPEWSIELSRNDYGFICPLMAAEAKRQRKAEKRKEEKSSRS